MKLAAAAGGFTPTEADELRRAMGHSRSMRKMAPIVERRRRDPGDDLISVLVDPRHEDTLTNAGLFQFIVLLLVAGNETTTNLIGNAVVSLIRHPDQLARVAADPALIPGTIEETLRFDGPIHLLFRTATRDVELGGQRIREGDAVVPLLASANRDPRAFEDPEILHAEGELDPVRDIETVSLELMLADLTVIEKRLERLEKDIHKMRTPELERELETLTHRREELE